MSQDEHIENINDQLYENEVIGNTASQANGDDTEDGGIKMTQEEIDRYDRLIQVSLIVQTGYNCLGSI